MTEIKTAAADAGLEDARRALDGALAELRGKMDRFMLPPESGGMSPAERSALRDEIGAADEPATRTRLRQEVVRLEGRLELVESRLPPLKDTTDAAAVAADARVEADRLRASRAYLAREVFAGNAARLPDLEECEARIKALELERERAEAIAAAYPE